jgi:HEAT repeat protein
VSETPPPTIDERIALADRLGQFCNGHPEHVPAALPQLLDVLESEDEPVVLAAVASALGAMWDPRCLPPLLKLVDHADRSVRLSVTQALPGALCNNETPEGLAALVVLTRDDDPTIRDWATFALAQSDSDSEEIRAALWASVDRDDGDVCGEALVGLARRGDRAVITPILRHLATDPGNLIVEAAES